MIKSANAGLTKEHQRMVLYRVKETTFSAMATGANWSMRRLTAFSMTRRRRSGLQGTIAQGAGL